MPELGEELATTVGHFFPQFNKWLQGLPDNRCAGKVIYAGEFCVWNGLGLFLQGLGSRRQFDHDVLADALSESGILLANTNRLAGTDQEDILHGDTLNDYLCQLPPEELQTLIHKMNQRLIRMRALEYARLYGRYLIAIDGTGVLVYRSKHCDSCLTKKVHGETIYYHPVLEAKLVTPDGFALSIGTEWMQNDNPNASKQDCERTAMKRLIPKIKEAFPRLDICLLVDALHANQTFFDLCVANGWDWIATFKKGSLPTLYDEFHTLMTLSPKTVLETRVQDRYQRLAWIENLEHEGHRVAVFDCLTYDQDQNVRYFSWITSMRVNVRTVVMQANNGGRLRWKIENEGFNNQKNQAYNLEHGYSDNPNAAKNWYFILQIAHMLVQLLLKGRLASAFKSSIKSVKNFFRRMSESLRHKHIRLTEIDPDRLRHIQIRFSLA